VRGLESLAPVKIEYGQHFARALARIVHFSDVPPAAFYYEKASLGFLGFLEMTSGAHAGPP